MQLHGDFCCVESIKDWINNGMPWRMGVALYKAHGENEYLKKVFDQGESQYRKRELEKALREILRNAKPVELVATTTEPVKQIIIQTTADDPLHDDREDPYREQWLPLYIEMNTWRHKLRLLPTDEERGKAAFRIIYLEELCEKYWEKRDYYLQTGQHLPDKPTDTASPIVTDLSNIERLYRNALSNVTRCRKKKSLEKRLQYWEEMRDKYKAMLGRTEKTDTV